MPYIVKSASKYKSVLEAEDLVSEGILSFFSAVKSYDSGKSSFKAFACLCVDRGMLSQYRYARALKRIPLGMISSIDDVDVPAPENPESLLIEKENFKNLYKGLRDKLSDFEYRVFCEFLEGKTYKQIAEQTGRTEKAVDNALRRVREKVKGR